MMHRDCCGTGPDCGPDCRRPDVERERRAPVRVPRPLIVGEDEDPAETPEELGAPLNDYPPS